MATYTLNVNGERHTVDVPAEMPLLWVLRDVIGLTGTKFGCGGGFCGACTVLVGGRVVRSCQRRVSGIGGSSVTTIEGLSRDGSHPVQKAWIDQEVPQCGYCQSGQIMAAASLLEARPNPTDQQIDDWMSTNICRCGTYDRVRRAIHRAAQEG